LILDEKVAIPYEYPVSRNQYPVSQHNPSQVVFCSSGRMYPGSIALKAIGYPGRSRHELSPPEALNRILGGITNIRRQNTLVESFHDTN